jgi:hypothetical protein
MDPAVSLVQAYFYANGYFTVSEYPVVEARSDGRYRSLTDLDILAVRFPGVRRLLPSGEETYSDDVRQRVSDPVLGHLDGRIEFAIVEVKEGRAELNRGAIDPGVLRTALARFGAFDPDEIDGIVEHLIRDGEALPSDDVRIRLFAFGSSHGSKGSRKYTVVTLAHVVDYFTRLFQQNIDIMPAAQFKDPAVGLLALLAKATLGRGAAGRGER